MKRFFTLLISLLAIGSMYANDYLYIEDFEVQNDRLYKIVPIKAHFEDYVSAFQVDLVLPEGLTISCINECSDLILNHCNSDGSDVDYYPMVAVNNAKTRYIALSMESDYYNGTNAGVAKWHPNDYIMFELVVDIAQDFRGGKIEVSSVTSSGGDNRPWVHTCNGCYVNTTTKVTVDGIEPEPDPEPDPEEPVSYPGYWLVAEGDTINFPRTIRLDLHDHKYDDQPFAYHFVIDGVSFGAQHDGVPTSIEVEDNILIATSHFDYTLEGGRSYIITVWNGIPHYIFLTPIPENNGGADAVDEVVNDRQVKDIRYYDINGREMREPNGITIVVTTYTDGSRNATKILKR